VKEQRGDPVFVQTRGGPRKEDWDGAPALARPPHKAPEVSSAWRDRRIS